MMTGTKQLDAAWRCAKYMIPAALTVCLFRPSYAVDFSTRLEAPKQTFEFPATETFRSDASERRLQGESYSNAEFYWRSAWTESPEWGGRTAFLDGAGNLYARAGKDLSTPWVLLATNVVSFQILDWRLAVLKSNGSLYLAEGALNAALLHVSDKVKRFQLGLTRLGILQDDGHFLVKEFGYLPRLISRDVKAFQVLLDRVGVLKNNGDLYLHEGGFINILRRVAVDVTRFQLEREWIIILNGTDLFVGKGSMFNVQFLKTASTVKDFEAEVTVYLGGSRSSNIHLALISESSQLSVGGGPTLPLQLAALAIDNVSSLQWFGRRLLVNTINGRALVGDLSEDNSSLKNLVDLGRVDRVSAVQEGRLTISRSVNSLSMIELPKANSVVAAPADSRQLSDLAEYSIHGVGQSSLDVRGLEQSSMRPARTRRAIYESVN